MQINNLPLFKLNNSNSILKRECFYSASYPNLSPLKQDTVSFKGEKVKKSDFKGVDLYILEKNRYDVQQFKSKNDIQKLAGEEIEKLTNKEYGGRQEETKVQRKAMFKEWFDYVTKENDAYSNTQRLVILSAVTKDLKPNNDNIPPALNKGVLADTVSELEEKLKNNPKEKFDFNKMYQNNLRKDLFEDTDTGETETKWVIIPSKENDPENFEKNVDRLKLLSHKTWCTKNSSAKSYLSEGDFHVYLENGQPKLCIRFVGNKAIEVQCKSNTGVISLEYLEQLKQYILEAEFGQFKYLDVEIQKAEVEKNRMIQAKNDLKNFIKLESPKDAIKIFEYFEMSPEINPDKTLTIWEYKQPSEYYSFSNLGIEENKFFKFVSKITDTACFNNSKATDLGILSEIGGDAHFHEQKFKSLNNIAIIEGNAYFHCCYIEDLGKLKEVGGNVILSKTNLTNDDFINIKSSKIYNL